MSVYRQKNKKWRAELYYQGKRIWGKSGFNTKREAEDALAEARRKAKRKAPAPALGYKELVNTYLAWSERKHTIQTVKYKFFVYREFYKHLGDNVPADTIDAVTIEDYLHTRPSNNNFNVHRKELSALFTWAYRRGLVPQNPCVFLDTMPVEKAERYVPSPEDVTRVLLVAGEDRPLLQVLYYTLARIDEVLRLEWRHVDFNNKVVMLGTRKRRSGEIEYDPIPMGDELEAVLLSLWRRREQAKWVFYNRKTRDRYYHRPKLMRTLCKKAGVPHFGFHAIRHHVASLLKADPETDTLAISKLLRHKNLRTTEIYLHAMDNAVRAAAAKIPDPLENSKKVVINNDCLV